MPRDMKIREKTARMRSFYRSEHRVPTYNEMLEMFDYSSKNSVFELLKKLEEQGYVEKGQGGKLSFTSKLTGSIRMLGTIQAGFPSPAEEQLAETVTLDEFLVERPEETYMLRVIGDSMLDAGIHPGDIVLVEKGREPHRNDIVIARVDEEWTLKYFIRDDRGVSLEPANKKYRTIRPQNSLEVAGIVRAVIRKYS